MYLYDNNLIYYMVIGSRPKSRVWSIVTFETNRPKIIHMFSVRHFYEIVQQTNEEYTYFNGL